MANKNATSLPFHEWWTLIAAAASLITLVVVTYLSNEKNDAQINENCWIEVSATGAVKIPGTYLLPKGSHLNNLLEKIQLQHDANVQRLVPNTKLRHGQVIRIPRHNLITVYSEGVVNTHGYVQLPKGSTVKDLLAYAKPSENADLGQLTMTRKLKDHEVVFVPPLQIQSYNTKNPPLQKRSIKLL